MFGRRSKSGHSLQRDQTYGETHLLELRKGRKAQEFHLGQYTSGGQSLALFAAARCSLLSLAINCESQSMPHVRRTEPDSAEFTNGPKAPERTWERFLSPGLSAESGLPDPPFTTLPRMEA